MIRKMRLMWGWPVVIICSAVAASLVAFVLPATIALSIPHTNETLVSSYAQVCGAEVRPILVMWFLFVCPGMTLVRFFRIQGTIITWILALALSFSIDTIVASSLLYAGRWSPTTILAILIGYCLVGATVQLVSTFCTPRVLPVAWPARE